MTEKLLITAAILAGSALVTAAIVAWLEWLA